jgi:hypothetical protein
MNHAGNIWEEPPHKLFLSYLGNLYALYQHMLGRYVKADPQYNYNITITVQVSLGSLHGF